MTWPALDCVAITWATSSFLLAGEFGLDAPSFLSGEVAKSPRQSSGALVRRYANYADQSEHNMEGRRSRINPELEIVERTRAHRSRAMSKEATSVGFQGIWRLPRDRMEQVESENSHLFL